MFCMASNEDLSSEQDIKKTYMLIVQMHFEE
jgi:hypothetical protein